MAKKRAVAAGAKLIRPAQASSTAIAPHIEDLSMAELKKRGKKAMKEMGG